MVEAYRRSKVEKFIARLEAKAEVYKSSAFGSVGYGRHEALIEVIAELRHEFKLKDGVK